MTPVCGGQRPTLRRRRSDGAQTGALRRDGAGPKHTKPLHMSQTDERAGAANCTALRIVWPCWSGRGEARIRCDARTVRHGR